jgi:hypothetical protein
MSTRNRLTWQRKNADQNKKASPPPQMPAVDRTEEPDHPAYYPDPEANKYETGDTSAFAEDPHSPMEPESAPPAMPGNLTTMELEHPATSDFQRQVEKPSASEGGAKQAADSSVSLKEMAEKRAALCVRIASALMPGADVATVENKALELMDLDERQLQATLETIKVTAGEEMEMEEEVEMEEEDMEKAASGVVMARLDNIENSIGKLVQAMTGFFDMASGQSAAADKSLLTAMMHMEEVNIGDADGDGVNQNAADYAYSDKSSMDMGDEEEGMLRAMLEEMEMEDKMASLDKDATAVEDATEPLAKGKGIQSGEGGNVNPDKYAETPQVEGPQTGGTAVKNAGENDIDMTAGDDPMGLVASSDRADQDLLALYSDMDLGKSAAEDEDTDDDEEADKEASSKRAGEEEMEMEEEEELELEPQDKTAGHVGPKTLGNVAMSHTASSDISELEKLWESAPDVSDVFGVPKA